MNTEGQQGTECHLDTLYQQVVMVHARNPSGTTSLQESNVRAEGYNPSCGDELAICLCGEPGATGEAQLAAVQVLVLGCSICRASGSILWERVQNKSIAEIQELIHHFREVLDGAVPNEDILGEATAMRGVARFPVRIDCALLPWTTMDDALQQLASQNPR